MNINTTLIRGIRREEKRAAKRAKGAERDFTLFTEREEKKRAEQERRDQRRKEKEWLLETCF